MSASELSGAAAPVGLSAGEATGPVAAAPTRDAAQAPRPEDIARWVREAGWSGLYTEWSEPTGNAEWNPVKSQLTVPVTSEQIERFAGAAYAAGAAVGIERAKRLMLEMSPELRGAFEKTYMDGAAAGAAVGREAAARMFDGPVWSYDYREIAAAIRAGGKR